MSSEVSARVAGPEDFEALVDLKWSMNRVEAAYLPGGSRFATRLDLTRAAAAESTRDNLDWIARDGGEMLVFERDGAIVGCGGWGWSPATAETQVVERAQVLLFGIVVAESMRGQGFGRVIMQMLEARAVAAGARWAKLEVIAANTPAVHLYKTQGFEPVEMLMIKDLRG